jgi:hypothetical protein
LNFKIQTVGISHLKPPVATRIYYARAQREGNTIPAAAAGKTKTKNRSSYAFATTDHPESPKCI